MKKIIISMFFFVISLSLTMAQTWVNGYYKSDGTYVPGHFRSNSNNTTLDNYSTKGNVNPFTGERGYKDPFESSNSYRSFNNNYNLELNNDVKVKSYFKDNGTQVESYYRTKPNNSLWDNYSTQGNYNPYTGKTGNKKIR